MATLSPPIDRWLRASLLDEPDGPVVTMSPAVRAMFVRSAMKNRISWYARRLLQRSGLGADKSLEAQIASSTMNHLRQRGDLSWLRSRIDDVGPWALLKGADVAQLHVNPVARPSSDLDVLVLPEHFATVVDVLEASGAWPLHGYWGHAMRQGWGEFPIALPSGTILDLHWHVGNRQRLRDAFPAHSAGLLEHRQDRGAWWGLSEVDRLIHLCVHAAVSGGHLLMWLKDIDLALRTLSPEGREVLPARARWWRAELVVAIMVDRAEQLAGDTALSGRLSAARVWRRVSGEVYRREQHPHRGTAHHSPSRALLRATRMSTATSSWELIHRLGTALLPELPAVDDVFDRSDAQTRARSTYLATIPR